MRRYFAVLLSTLFVFGCVTVQNSGERLSLASVESLQIGKVTAPDLRERFGEPSRIFPLSSEENAWYYEAREGDHFVQKAGFVLSKGTGLLLTASWIPTGQDPMNSRDIALAHFRGASFQIRNLGPVASHEYSNEVIYFDQKTAVSIRVNQTNQNVIAISFGDATIAHTNFR